ncbi:uncharacterized protein LOC134788282, partial [Penaeus indicus]|uniref:uncharacterized protein LOC134788282 n=1 Tax=Penaeus indicus TaxID=29960 RepID=UPI00300CB80D
MNLWQASSGGSLEMLGSVLAWAAWGLDARSEVHPVAKEGAVVVSPGYPVLTSGQTLDETGACLAEALHITGGTSEGAHFRGRGRARGPGCGGERGCCEQSSGGIPRRPVRSPTMRSTRHHAPGARSTAGLFVARPWRGLFFASLLAALSGLPDVEAKVSGPVSSGNGVGLPGWLGTASGNAFAADSPGTAATAGSARRRGGGAAAGELSQGLLRAFWAAVSGSSGAETEGSGLESSGHGFGSTEWLGSGSGNTFGEDTKEEEK